MSTPVRAPQRTPIGRPSAVPPPRPDLRIVRLPEGAPRRRLVSPAVATALGGALLFVILFGLAAFHTVLLQGQQRLDDLDRRVAEEQARYERLRLGVASIESPERIVAEATRLGMVAADSTTYLTPSGAVEAEIASAAANENDENSPAPPSPDDVATGAADWSEVKPYLGDTP